MMLAYSFTLGSLLVFKMYINMGNAFKQTGNWAYNRIASWIYLLESFYASLSTQQTIEACG